MLIGMRCATLIFIAALASIAEAAPIENGPEVGKESPNLIGRTLNGDLLYRLSSDKSKPKVVNFFWVQCVPCRLEMPELAQLEALYPDTKFISVHAKEDSREVVTAFIKALPGAPSAIVLTNGGVQEAFRYMGLPHTILLDKNNIVLANFTGYTPQNMQQLRKLLDSMSKKKSQ